MAELGLGIRAGEEEEEKEKVEHGKRRRGKLSSRWSIRRRRRRASEGGNDESTFYSECHSSVDEESYWFASAPGSIGGRFSFGSDLTALSMSPRFSFTNLAGCEPSFLPGLDPEPETRASSPSTIANTFSTKSNKLAVSKDQRLDIVRDKELEQEERTIDTPVSSTVPHNLREDSQNQRFTFDSLCSPGGRRRWRPGSLDLNSHGQNAGASSLHTFTGGSAYMKNICAPVMHTRSNMFPSPGTPNYWDSNVGVGSYHKGWSSERVPLPARRGQRYVGNAPLFPFNNGRTMPSKWEDAERWICSPVSGDGSKRPVVLPPYHRRPKSKSGPLGTPELTCGPYALASPQIPCFDNGKVVNFAGSSPFLAGVLITDQQLCGINGGENFCTRKSEVHIDRSASMDGCLDSSVQSSTLLPADVVCQGYRLDRTHEIAAMISPVALNRDVGTQMSPAESTQSSPKERPSSLSQSPLYVHTITELQSNFPCLEIRDVQVDDRVTVTRWSKKHISRCSDRRSTDIIEWKRKTLDCRTSDWEVIGTERCMSKKYDREEAKIAAWENLQKAKAEAALQKLEMKLEKKRSSSMEKILNKLRSAQRRAQDMRSSLVDGQVCIVPRTYFRKYGRMFSLRVCFSGHAF